MARGWSLVSVVALVVAVPAASAHDVASDWASYRLGPERLGAGTNTGPGAAGAPPAIAWTVSVQSTQSGAPVVAGSTIVFGYTDTSSTPSHGYVRAIDLATHADRWSVPFGNSVQATPMVAGDQVLALSMGNPADKYDYSGHLGAFDLASGAKRWDTAFCPSQVSCSSATSPLVLGGNAYVATNCSAKCDGTVLAIRLADGGFAWRGGDSVGGANANALAGWGGRIFEATRAGPQQIGGGPGCNRPCSNDFVYALDLADGRIAWRADPTDPASTDDDLSTTPVVVDGRVYVAASYVAAFDDDHGHHDAIPSRLFALDAKDGRTLWTATLEDGSWLDPSYVDGRLVAADAKGRLHLLDAATGREDCARCWGGPVALDDAATTSVLVGDDTAYVGTIQLGPCPGQQGLVQGALRGTLHAVALDSGAERWRLDLGLHMPTGGLALAHGRLVLVTHKYSQGCGFDGTTEVNVVGGAAATHAPDAPPTLDRPSPVDKGRLAGGEALAWHGSDADAGDALRYDVYYGAGDPPLVAHLQTAASWRPDEFASGTWSWRVVAYDAHGATAQGPVWTLTCCEGGVPTTTPHGTSGSPKKRGALEAPEAWAAITVAGAALALARRRS